YLADGESGQASIGLGFDPTKAVTDTTSPDYNQYGVIPFHSHAVSQAGTTDTSISRMTLPHRVNGTDVTVTVNGTVLPQGSGSNPNYIVADGNASADSTISFAAPQDGLVTVSYQSEGEASQTGTTDAPVSSMTLPRRVSGTDVTVTVDGTVLPQGSSSNP